MATAGVMPPKVPWSRDENSESYQAVKEFYDPRNLRNFRIQSKWAFILAIISIIFTAISLLIMNRK